MLEFLISDRRFLISDLKYLISDQNFSYLIKTPDFLSKILIRFTPVKFVLIFVQVSELYCFQTWNEEKFLFASIPYKVRVNISAARPCIKWTSCLLTCVRFFHWLMQRAYKFPTPVLKPDSEAYTKRKLSVKCTAPGRPLLISKTHENFTIPIFLKKATVCASSLVPLRSLIVIKCHVMPMPEI